MAVKTFTSGETLTASDTNTYLANSGLVYITSATVGSGVSSVTVSNVFSSTYDNYHIIYSGGTLSTGDSISLKIGNATTNYNMWMVYESFTAGTNTPKGSGLVNQPLAYWVGGGDTNAAVAETVVIGPNLAKYTFWRNTGFYFAGTYGGWSSGVLKDTTQHTSFSLSPLTATMTGGTITVYGFRKA